MQAERRELEFLSTLGTGGFGAVYLANLHGRDRFVRRVAVKVMREGLDATPDLVARQKDEARLLGLLAHDGIVQVLDLAEVQGRPAVVMEYVEGVDLADIVRSIHPRRVPVRAALEMILAAASALDAAYNSSSALTGQPLRVIHRDIKPANLLLTVHGRLKVLDFGVAKADFARDGHTTNGSWGTPRFMSPEQWLGDSYGAAIDIYALGVTLFELVANRPWERPPLARTPFEASIAGQLDAQQDVPEATLALIAAMTAFDAEDRPTAAEVRERAEATLVDAPGEPLGRFARSVVPPLVEARNRTNANKPLPGPVSLGNVSRSEAALPVDRTFESSIATERPTSSLPAMAGAFVVGVGLSVLAAAAIGLVLFNVLGRQPVEPEPEPVAVVEGAQAQPAVEVDPRPDPEPKPEPAPSGAEVEPEAPVETPVETLPETPQTKPPPKIVPDKPKPPEPAPPKPAPVVAAQTFPFGLTSTPTGAELWVDGEMVGTTPKATYLLTEGTHTVQVVLDGERSSVKTVTVSEGATGVRYYFKDKKWRSGL